jgi:hypothetical protein
LPANVLNEFVRSLACRIAKFPADGVMPMREAFVRNQFVYDEGVDLEQWA